MIRVCTGSRLHFGLLSLPGGVGPLPPWTNVEGEAVMPARSFGGAGVMIDQPGLELTVSPASSWSAVGPLADRALAFARQYAVTVPAETVSPQRIQIERCTPEHCGLGTGTQLGLAVAKALETAWELPPQLAPNLALAAGRGLRSGLGVHGFDRGGFLVDGGKGSRSPMAPLLARVAFPAEWRIVLIHPTGLGGLHGTDEVRAFEQLEARLRPGDAMFSQQHTDHQAMAEVLCRIVLLGMVPALIEADFAAFSEAVFDFNARVGDAFAAVQGGRYADARTQAIVSWLRSANIRGVGQSSWGPTIFAFTRDELQAGELVQRVLGTFCMKPTALSIAKGLNRGAFIAIEKG